MDIEDQQQNWHYYGEGTVEQPSGKWMLYYRNEDIDEAWEKAKQKFPELQQAGIPAMKCSNRFVENPRASNNATQVIIFYCGPATVEESMKSIGRALISLMDYRSPTSNKIHYKADYQTHSGTRATGTKVNHLYSLPVEYMWPGSGDGGEDPANEPSIPLFTKTKPGWDYRISGLPSVRLHIKAEHINGEWRRAKHLLINENLMKECVAVDCDTMATTRVQSSLLMRMKFYLNIDVSKQEPDQMMRFIRDIYNSIQFVTDETVGLYEKGNRKPLISIKLN